MQYSVSTEFSRFWLFVPETIRKQFVEGASLVVTVHLGISLPLVRTSSTIMSQSGGLDHVAHSLMNADDTNSVSSLIGDVTYSVSHHM
jgi:hypothetical protein